MSVLSFLGIIILAILYLYLFMKCPLDILKKEVKKNRKYTSKEIIFALIKILVYTLLFILFYYIVYKLLWYGNKEVECLNATSISLCTKSYASSLKTIPLLLSLISAFIVYYYFLLNEIKTLLKNSYLLACLVVSILEIFSLVYLPLQVILLYGIFKYLVFNTVIEDTLRGIIICLPPIILGLHIYGTKVISYISSKVVKKKKRKRSKRK